VIGVNLYPVDGDEEIDVLKVDNAAVRAQQIAKLERLRAERDQAEVDAALAGVALTIGFNARYLIDVLGALDAERVAFELSHELDPCVVRPVGRADFCGVLMPMRVS
jgi:methylmalonyl-CoA mutase